MTGKAILLTVYVIVMIVILAGVLYAYMGDDTGVQQQQTQPVQSVPQPLPQEDPTDSTPYDQTPIPAPVELGAWCQGGLYCDRSAIDAADAQSGSTVCGAGNKVYVCNLNRSWGLTGAACGPNDAHRCPTSAPTTAWCGGGAYCDGTSIPADKAQAGMSVCGGGSRIYKCGDNRAWFLTGASCGPNDVHRCSDATAANDANSLCKGGSYCTGGAIPASSAQSGSIVCGGGNNIYKCNPDGSWSLTGAKCTAGMTGMC